MKGLEHGARWLVLGDSVELSQAGAERIIEALSGAIDLRGRASIALSGGSTPRATYALLRSRSDALDWMKVDVFWADERFVPEASPERNARMATELFLEALAIPRSQVHVVPTGSDPISSAREYSETVCRVLGEPPRLDVVVLGLGTDGHTASLFPGTAAQPNEWVAATRSPVPPPDRVTLTLATLNEAREVIFLVSGPDKAAALRDVTELGSGPAAQVRPRAGTVRWLVDRSARY